MLTYKMNSAGVSPTLVIPKVGGVDNPAVDIFIDTEERTTRLYVAYISPCGQILKPFIFNWLQHDCGVLPEYFADRLLGGVRAVKVITSSARGVTIRLKPLSIKCEETWTTY